MSPKQESLAPPPASAPAPALWQDRLADVVAMMREIGAQSDPQAMVRQYGARARRLIQTDGSVSMSRRDLATPRYRITRSWRWTEEINPWLQKDKLPLLDRGILGELLYANEPQLMLDFHANPSDPAYEHLADFRSLAFVPMYDGGEAINGIVQLRHQPDGFNPERFPEAVWMTNLFGRATHNLVLKDEAQHAYDQVDRELRAVADIQHSLLPTVLPRIPGLELAAHYQTARRAGGDYYDFFPLPEGRWGVLIADVSGHGTPAAVVMAATHAIAHAYTGPPAPPAGLMGFLNNHLVKRQVPGATSFVTAFYGIFDPATRQFSYCNAGHNPPCLRRAADGTVVPIEGGQSLPLGIDGDEVYTNDVCQLQQGDHLLLYTDGITEARGPGRGMFGIERLSQALAAADTDAATTLATVMAHLHRFTTGIPADDDRTILSARVV